MSFLYSFIIIHHLRRGFFPLLCEILKLRVGEVRVLGGAGVGVEVGRILPLAGHLQCRIYLKSRGETNTIFLNFSNGYETAPTVSAEKLNPPQNKLLTMAALVVDALRQQRKITPNSQSQVVRRNNDAR